MVILRVRIRFSVQLVSGYVHISALLSVVIVTPPSRTVSDVDFRLEEATRLRIKLFASSASTSALGSARTSYRWRLGGEQTDLGGWSAVGRRGTGRVSGWPRSARQSRVTAVRQPADRPTDRPRRNPVLSVASSPRVETGTRFNCDVKRSLIDRRK